MIGWGADADALEHLAQLIGGYAAQLDHRRTVLSVEVRHSPWQGHNADQFRHDWDHRHVPAIISAAAFLHEASSTLRTNAEQQRQASSDGGSSGSSVGQSRLSPTDYAQSVWQGLRTASRGFDAVSGVVGLFALKTTGRYTNVWRGVNELVGPFARYKSSPVLVALNNSPTYRWAHGVATHLDDSRAFAAFGTVASVVGIAEHGVAGMTAAAHGNTGTALVEASDTVSSGLKSSRNPVGYLSGVALSVWTSVAEESSKVDLKQGIPAPWDGNAWSNLWVPAMSDAVKSMPGRMAKWFL